jgi:omega-hydroxy-beta-dihydromenaquinone-9 sulfotransferase
MIADRAATINKPNQRLIFVVGNSRSGTTMMGRILGKHPEIFTFHELHFFEQLWTPTEQSQYLAKPEAERLAARLLCIQRDGYLTQGEISRFWEESQDLIASIQEKTLTPTDVYEAFVRYETAKHAKRIPCDQTPRNVFYIGEILELYPEARIINMIRDPRDVLLSQKGKWKRRSLGANNIPRQEAIRSWINYHPIIISQLWNASIRAAERFADRDRVYALRFEDLLANPEETVQKICQFISISFEKSLLEIPQIGSSCGVDRPEQTGINPDRAGSWQKGGLNSVELFLCQKITNTLMERNGYKSVPVSPHPLALAYSLTSVGVKLTLALLFNLKRMRNITETIRRRLA